LNPIEEGILRTILYADVFDFPMTISEIAHYLISEQPYSLEQVEHTLSTSKHLANLLECRENYFFRIGRHDVIAIRHARESASMKLWDSAMHYGTWLAYLPFVRMVALTGALAVRNAANGDDDLDYVVVTAPRRVWLARAFAILLVRAVKLRGKVICPNYVMSETVLEQPQQDLFMAHEVAQIIPIFGGELYRRFREQNLWSLCFLPNASKPYFDVTLRNGSRFGIWIKQAFEMLLTGKFGDALESWEHERKIKRFAAEMQKPHSAAVLDDHRVKGHFDDHGHPVLKKYHALLREYNLCDISVSLPLAGD
jgi:hypothetical protein